MEIILNWKMNGDSNTLINFLNRFASKERIHAFKKRGVDLGHIWGLCLPAPLIGLAFHFIKVDSIKIHLGAQQCSYLEDGAHTGLVSAKVLCSLNCSRVLVGHSEVREREKPSQDILLQTIQKAVDHSIDPILCIGEKFTDHESGKTLDVLKKQLEGLEKIVWRNDRSLIVAYEPIWAIGSGKTPTPEEIINIVQFIRNTLMDMGMDMSSVRVLYGGSVSMKNIKMLEGMGEKEEIDGVLVGAASFHEDFLNYFFGEF